MGMFSHPITLGLHLQDQEFDDMTPSAAKPTIIFCSGAWHTEAHIKPIIPHFEKLGYRVVPRQLPTAGHKLPNGAQDGIRILQTTFEAELKKGEIIAPILHSAAGILGTAAINNILATTPEAKSRIRIVYLGTSLGQGPFAESLRERGHFRVDPSEGVVYVEKAHELFFEEMAEQDSRPFVEALTFQSSQEKPELETNAFEECDLWSLCCEKDKVIPLHLQVQIAKKHRMQIVRLDTGHCPFVTRTEEFVAVVDRILRSPDRNTDME